jgi:hypothetical protein
MSARSLAIVSFVVGALATGCTVTGASRIGEGEGRDGGTTPTFRADGSSAAYPDGSVNSCNPACGPTELCGDDGNGNGLDDNCDGAVDEGCTCTTGERRPCFLGPPDRRDHGACSDGVETCSEFGIWSACLGGTSPSAEVCNGADDDCNDLTDDLPGCTSAFTCPSNETALPLARHTLRGARVAPSGATNWQWAIACPDSVPAELCPSLATPNAENTDVYFSASGAYRVSVSVRLADGTDASCAWTVYVRGGGLRVELNWDTMPNTHGGTDVDLHLHRWTQDGVDTPFFTDTDDCYYATCQPDDEYSWPEHGDSDLSACSTAPHGGGADWTARGSCRNPRLDVDTNGTDGACDVGESDPDLDAFCAAENINVDAPVIGMPYRIMVNYFSDHGYAGETNPTVNIFCGGAIRGSFGSDPFVFLRNGQGAGAENDNWLVADVVFFEGACGLDCMVYPLGDIVRGEPDPEDPFGFFYVAPFGPPWSCHYDPATSSCDP